MPTPVTEQMKPGISPRLREKVNGEIVRCLQDAIAGTRDRADRLQMWDRQLRGDPWWAGIRPRWRGACDVEDPLTREAHLGQAATDMFYLAHTQRVVVNPLREEDEAAAGNMEAWLNDLFAKHGFSGKIGYDLVYNRARHSYAVLYIGWTQQYATQRQTVYRNKATGEVLDDPEDRIPGEQYEVLEDSWDEVEDEGLECRVVHGGDWGMYPAQAQTPSEALFCWERVWYSASDLLDGVSDYGYDAATVQRLLARGPVAEDPSQRGERDQDEGLYSGDGDLYQCYIIHGRPPVLLENGKSLLPSEQRRRDYQWLVCGNEVFSFRPAPYKRRPYVLFPFLREPGRLMGDGVCSLIEPLHREATIALRFRIDSRDLYMSGTLLVPSDEFDELQRFKQYPGAMIPYEAGKYGASDVIRPLPTDKAGFRAAMEDGIDLRQRAQVMLSSAARQQMSGTQPRTAREVSNVSAGYDEKTDLFLSCLNEGMQEAAEVMISHYAQFAGSQAISALVGGQAIEITPEMLQTRFRIEAAGQSQDADPEARLNKATALLELVHNSPIVQQAVMRGDLAPEWVAEEHVARALGLRDAQIKAIFGAKPQPAPTADMLLQQLTAAIQQFAEQGDPAAIQLLLMLQQMMAEAQQMAAMQQGGAPGAGPRASLSVNYRDMAPNDQAAAMQMMGFPPPSGGQGAPQGNGTGRQPQQMAA